MAAAIEKEFGIVPDLKKGHGGIFEVSVEASVVYTNGGVCGSIPSNEEILQKIRQQRDHTLQPPGDKLGQGGVKARSAVPKPAAAPDDEERSC